MTHHQELARIDELRTNLSDKLAELHRRAVRAKQLVTPSTYWKSPWVKAGIGVAIGYALLTRRRDATHESLVHAIVRSALSAATSVLVTRALVKD